MTNLYFYHVLDEEFFRKVSIGYMESGLFVDTFDTIKKMSNDFFMKENRIYHTVKEYVDDLISFDNLGIGNFYGIFKMYFLVCSIISIVFVIHLIINDILSRSARRWTTEFIIYSNFQRFVNITDRIVFSFKSTCLQIKNLFY